MHLHFTHPCNFLFAFRWWNFLWSVHHVLDITICILQIHHLLYTRHLLLLIHQMFDAATSLPRHIKNRTSVTSSPGFFSRNIFSCHTVMSWELARCNEMSFIPYLMSCLLCYCYCKWIGFPTYMKHIWNTIVMSIHETPLIVWSVMFVFVSGTCFSSLRADSIQGFYQGIFVGGRYLRPEYVSLLVSRCSQ